MKENLLTHSRKKQWRFKTNYSKVRRLQGRLERIAAFEEDRYFTVAQTLRKEIAA